MTHTRQEASKKIPLSEEMAQKLIFTPAHSPSKEDSEFIRLAKKIPFFGDFTRKMVDTVRVSGSFATDEGDQDLSSTALKDLHIAGVALTAIDWLKIPAIYAFAAIAGEKIPFSLNKNVRWAYTSAVLGLSIATLVVPAVLPILAVTLSTLGMASGIFMLGKAVYKQRQLKAELKQIDDDIKTQSGFLQGLINKTKALESQLADCKSPELKDSLNAQLSDVQQRFEKDYKVELETGKLQELYERKQHCEKKLAEYNPKTVMNRSIGLGLAAVALTGATLLFFFPPVGLALMAGASVVGLGYAATQIIVPFISKAWTKLFGKTAQQKPEDSAGDEHTAKAKPVEHYSDSTEQTMHQLFPDPAQEKHALQTLISDYQCTDRIHKKLRQLVSNKDQQGLLEFFAGLSDYANSQKPPAHADDLQGQFNVHNYSELKTAFSLLRKPMDDIRLSASDIDKLSTDPIKTLLSAQNIDVKKSIDDLHSQSETASLSSTRSTTPNPFDDE
jgi:hypothetical protein